MDQSDDPSLLPRLTNGDNCSLRSCSSVYCGPVPLTAAPMVCVTSPALRVAPPPIDQSSSGVAYSVPLTPATIGNEPPVHRVSSDCFKKYICTVPVPFILRPTTINETLIVMMMMIIISILIVISNYLFHVKNGVRTILKNPQKT